MRLTPSLKASQTCRVAAKKMGDCLGKLIMQGHRPVAHDGLSGWDLLVPERASEPAAGCPRRQPDAAESHLSGPANGVFSAL